MRRILPDEAATRGLGAELAQAMRQLPADALLVCHLEGELGAGKTSCVRGFLAALGVARAIKSPTYALLETYELERRVIHCDLYRLKSAEELPQLGLADYLLPGHVLFIEWPEQGGRYVPPADLLVRLDYLGDARRATLLARSSIGEQWLSGLAS